MKVGNIVLLDDLTINKIAAGEVIENPSAAIKEMVENSIDAGATSIIVEVKNGGKSLIKIIDNGKGIAKEDIPLSIERHATSKLKQIEDLEKIDSFGFRGEALASIASISKMTIISKTNDDLTATKMVVEAGEILEISEDTGKNGTTIIIENLFFNVPVRYKFLKNDATEFRYIKSMLEKIAISNPSVAIKLINNGKEVLKTSGNGKLEDVIYVLFGKRISQNLVKVNYFEGEIEVTGFIGNTTIAVDSRKDELFFLNKRYIQNKTLYSSADEAFKGDAGIGKFSFAIINLKMPPSFYDVNIHPTKKEVKFKDEALVYRVLYTAIKNAVLSKEFLGNKAIEENKEYVNSEFKYVTNHFFNLDNNKTDLETDNTNNVESNNNDEVIKRENARKIDYKFIRD
ncbi:MAG TPA: DNA mismatch repair endonuclease MutL [Clostridiales bacterium]|nr:DNA mismatch repair endonuclease MutL [Clostridiales bacterium]